MYNKKIAGKFPEDFWKIYTKGDLELFINMEVYANKSGRSSVYAYIIGADFISVQFKNGKVYRYAYSRAGSTNVERMKILARQGLGLNTYIKTQVNLRYG